MGEQSEPVSGPRGQEILRRRKIRPEEQSDSPVKIRRGKEEEVPVIVTDYRQEV